MLELMGKKMITILRYANFVCLTGPMMKCKNNAVLLALIDRCVDVISNISLVDTSAD